MKEREINILSWKFLGKVMAKANFQRTVYVRYYYSASFTSGYLNISQQLPPPDQAFQNFGALNLADQRFWTA